MHSYRLTNINFINGQCLNIIHSHIYIPVYVIIFICLLVLFFNRRSIGKELHPKDEEEKQAGSLPLHVSHSHSLFLIKIVGMHIPTKISRP